jgi:hypothetical protein
VALNEFKGTELGSLQQTNSHYRILSFMSFLKSKKVCGGLHVTMDTHFSRISACWLRYASNCHLDLRQVGLSSTLKVLASIKRKNIDMNLTKDLPFDAQIKPK